MFGHSNKSIDELEKELAREEENSRKREINEKIRIARRKHSPTSNMLKNIRGKINQIDTDYLMDL